MKQTILVTGASSGFGLLVAKKLHESGHRVIGTSRNPEKHQGQVPFKLLSLDVTDDASVGSFGKRLFGEIKHLDVLINNAGFLVTGLAEETPLELGKKQIETNFWGAVRVTNELLPHFRKNRQGKIITIGSGLGLISLPNTAYYSASKHALEGYFKALRLELKQFNIQVSTVEPSSFKTNIEKSMLVARMEINDYVTFRKKIDVFTKKEFDNAPEPTPVVDTIISIIKTKEPRYSYPVGKGTVMMPFMQKYMYQVFEKIILKAVAKAT